MGENAEASNCFDMNSLHCVNGKIMPNTQWDHQTDSEAELDYDSSNCSVVSSGSKASGTTIASVIRGFSRASRRSALSVVSRARAISRASMKSGSTVVTSILEGMNPLKDRDDMKDIKKELKKCKKEFTPESVGEAVVGHDDIIVAAVQVFLNAKVLQKELIRNAILLAGVGGCGKTATITAAAVYVSRITKEKTTLFTMSAADFYQSYLGQTEKTIKILYKMAAKEGQSMIWIDEVDGLMKARYDKDSEVTRRFKNCFLAEMSKAPANVLTICATNKPWDIDELFIRRFRDIFFVHPPKRDERIDIFKKYLMAYDKSTKVDFESINLSLLADKTDKFTGDDIKRLVEKASNVNCKINLNGNLVDFDGKNSMLETLAALKEAPISVPVPMTTAHLLAAAAPIKPCYTQGEVRRLKKFEMNYIKATGGQYVDSQSPGNTVDFPNSLEDEDETVDCSRCCAYF